MPRSEKRVQDIKHTHVTWSYNNTTLHRWPQISCTTDARTSANRLTIHTNDRRTETTTALRQVSRDWSPAPNNTEENTTVKQHQGHPDRQQRSRHTNSLHQGVDSYSRYTGWKIHRQRHRQANRASWFKFVAVRRNPQITQLRPRGGSYQTKYIDEFSSFKGNFEREEQVEDTILDLPSVRTFHGWIKRKRRIFSTAKDRGDPMHVVDKKPLEDNPPWVSLMRWEVLWRRPKV